MKILLCFGTRPEAIKMAPVIHELKARKISYKVCVTAQHREMLDNVLEFFEINPDYDLDLMTRNQNLNLLSASILKEFDSILEQEMPQVVLVQGDTTSALMASVAAFNRRISVGHIEAGLRTYDLEAPFPEEGNRQLISKIASYHFAPTKRALQNLINERIIESRVLLTGNTVVDALNFGKSKVEKTVLPPLIREVKNNLDPTKKIVLVTGHRRENFGDGMEEICKALRKLALSKKVEIIFPVHLNPNIQEVVNNNLSGFDNIHLLEPLNYPDFLSLLNISDIIISDSGGIQEEAPSFNKFVIVTRELSERMEGVEAGFAFITGASTSKIFETTIKLLEENYKEAKFLNPYGDGMASKRIIDFLTCLNE